MSSFTEDVTESFYDSEDALYRSFWDTEGSLHWGLFDESTGQDFLKACANLNEFMANRAGLLPESTLLDIGCGNGNTAMWLSRTRECSVAGIDLSGVRITNAIQALEEEPAPLRDRVRFEKASATDLPFEDGAFSHVWSEATIYHIPDKVAALREAYRVLVLVVLFSLDVVSPRDKPCPLESPVIPTPAQIAVAGDLFRDECVRISGTVVFQHADVLVAEMNRGEYVQRVNVLGPSEVLGEIPLGRVVTLAGRLKLEEDSTYAVLLVPDYGSDRGWWRNLRENLEGLF